MQMSTKVGSGYNHGMHVDTLAISKLQAAGVSKKHAEVQAEVLGEVITNNIATKTDIESLRKDTKTDIENLRKDLTIEIHKVTITTIKWIVPLLAGQLLATAGLMKMFISN
jgi:hypothetical protein